MSRIGKKTTKKQAIKSLIITVIIASFFTFITNNIISLMPGNYHIVIAHQVEILIMLLIFILTIITIYPYLVTFQRIDFTDIEINYYFYSNYIEKIRSGFGILLNQTEIPGMQILISDIRVVKLSCQRTLYGYGIGGYAWVLSFYMKNGTLLILSPQNMIKNEDGNILDLLQLLQENEIEIIDNFNLKRGLVKDNAYFQNYVEQLTKAGIIKW